MPERRYPNPWHKDDPVKFSVAKREWTLDFPWDDMPSATKTDLERGKLTMKCTHCSQINIAGPWCPSCGRMVHFDNWINTGKAGGSKRKGRKSREELEGMFK